MEPRTYIAYILLQEGLTGRQVEKIMNRDRTTAIASYKRFVSLASYQPWRHDIVKEIMDTAAREAGYDRGS